MRTTIEFDADTAQAINELRQQGRGVGEAVNELIRRGLLAGESRGRRFEPRTRKLGRRIDVSNVADALDVLEGPAAR